MYQSSSGQTATGVAEYQAHIKPELDWMAVFLPLFTPVLDKATMRENGWRLLIIK